MKILEQILEGLAKFYDDWSIRSKNIYSNPAENMSTGVDDKHI